LRGRLSPPLVFLFAASFLHGGCASQKKKPMDDPPSAALADLVDYRNALEMLRDGRADEAMQLLAHARKVYPTNPNISNAIGLTLIYKKDYAGAVKAFDDALRLDPLFVESHNNRGVALMELGRLDEAEADFLAVLHGPATPEKTNAHYNLGLVNRKRAKWKDAEHEFSLALADSPQYLQAYRDRGLARVQMDDFRGALEDFLRVLKDEPKDPVANYQTALCLLTIDRDLALRYMERTVAAAPDSEEGRKARRFLDAEPTTPRPPEKVR
jgi:tetratricopeptide (TPR) repeat protein